MLTSIPTEGVMSGIISAKPFNTVFKATDGNSTMQGTVTAIYEIGMSHSLSFYMEHLKKNTPNVWP